MGHPPNRWKLLAVVLALATMVGCQGFSSAKPATQSAPVTSPGDLTAAPASIAFGNVQVGISQTLTDTVSNTGGTSLTISQATATGTGFAISGLTVPAILAPGQSATFNVTFNPTAIGAVSGNVALTNDGSGSPLNIALSGTAVAAGSLVANPTSMNLGSVQIGASQSQSETLTNSGSSSLTLTQATFGTTAGFSYTGLSLPITLAPNQSTTFSVVFAPTVAGTANSILSITVSGSSSAFDIALSGTGTLPAVLTASPTSFTFNGVQVGKSQTQTETVSNTGGASVIISQVAATGTGFSISGASTPITVAPGQSTAFSVVFAPKSSGSVTGNVTVTSNASDSSLVVGLSGSTATAAQGQLSVSPSTIGVGSVTVGTSGTQTASLVASGASVTVSGDSVGSSEFSISGLSFPFTLSAGQSANFTVTFSPQSSGAASTTISFTSNAANSPASATVTGTGVAAPAHAVNLGWTASSSPDISGYNIYRRTGTSGSYSQVNTTLDATTSYVDSTVGDGQTYYYEVAAVNSSNQESPPSSAVQAVIPPP